MDPGRRAAQILANTAKEISREHKPAIDAGAQAAKKQVLQELDKVTSGRKLRNVGKGAKLGVGYNVSGMKAKVFARGPWPIIERDIGDHAIRPRKRNGRRALKFGTGGIYARVSHPGTKGKHPFEKGFEASPPKVHKALADRYVKAVGNAW